MKFEKEELRKVGVEIVDHNQPKLKCLECGKVWWPAAKPGGGWHNLFYVCPHCRGKARGVEVRKRIESVGIGGT